MAANGCETNLTTSNTNCGGCGVVCGPEAQTSSAACVSSTCEVAHCQSGFGDCNGVYSDGCERNLQTDASNCGSCGSACPVNDACFNGNCVPAVEYATAQLNGTKKLVFLYAASGTAINSDAAYAAYCSSFGFTQNQNNSTAAVYTAAGMSNAASYYCTGYCCYLGQGNSQAVSLTGFQNFGLPVGTPLQVFDRGCGDYFSPQTYNNGVETTDTVTVTGATSFTYNVNALGTQNYNQAKTTTFSQNGVVVCETN